MSPISISHSAVNQYHCLRLDFSLSSKIFNLSLSFLFLSLHSTSSQCNADTTIFTFPVLFTRQCFSYFFFDFKSQMNSDSYPISLASCIWKRGQETLESVNAQTQGYYAVYLPCQSMYHLETLILVLSASKIKRLLFARFSSHLSHHFDKLRIQS